MQKLLNRVKIVAHVATDRHSQSFTTLIKWVYGHNHHTTNNANSSAKFPIILLIVERSKKCRKITQQERLLSTKIANMMISPSTGAAQQPITRELII